YGFWEDPGEWKWEEHGGFFTTNRVKDGDITVTMHTQTPDIAAEGGVASAKVSIRNNTDDEYSDLDFWAMVNYPTGEQRGPVLSFEADIIPKWFTPNLLLNQVVPASAPYGRYHYSLFIGTYPDDIIASDEFMFTKLPGDGVGELAEFDPSDWPVYMNPIVSEPDAEIVEDLQPQGFTFSEAWPNPFNPTTTLQLHLPMRSHVRMAVFDLMGRQVQELSNGIVQSGTHSYTVDGTGLASGMYFVRATIENQGTFHRKLVLMK
ncbi:MAG TPA: T9SS type A sorting domain-containing protein, partial [Bacteroidetes bacterium]|nr:T9SS type A sorting domain-containing protein [Bacteroidota bacterium]HEX04123.1 T9SS type A sorting domain-containing protein [Bacteroidota bacterium]